MPRPAKKAATKAAPKVEGEVVEIPFNDHVFTVPADRDTWSVESELALFEARATDLSYWWLKWIEAALGPKQYAKLFEVMKDRGDLVLFIQTFTAIIAKECGE